MWDRARERGELRRKGSPKVCRDPKDQNVHGPGRGTPKLSTEGLRGLGNAEQKGAGRRVWSHSGESSLAEIYCVNMTEPPGAQTSNWSNTILGVSGRLVLAKINI